MRAVTITRIFSVTGLDTRYGPRALVRLGIINEMGWEIEQDFWLSPCKYEILKDCFYGFDISSKHGEVMAILNEGQNGNEYIRFIFYISPKEQNLRWIEKEFNIEINPFYVELYNNDSVLIED